MESSENNSETTTAVSEIDQLKADLESEKNKYLYLYAEFDTYKKRVFKERTDLLKFGSESLAKELLGVIDNLELALKNTQNQDALVTGIKMVEKQFIDSFKKFGITAIEAIGQKFDPEKHEALSQEPVTDDEKNGTVTRELQKGFTLHGRLLRPAKVVVGTKS